MPQINITVTDQVPEELIKRMSKHTFCLTLIIETMGLDVEKVKVKKDSSDVKLKAQ